MYLAKGRNKLRKLKACLGESARKLTISWLSLVCNIIYIHLATFDLDIQHKNIFWKYSIVHSLATRLSLSFLPPLCPRMDAETMSIAQDTSAGWLCVRFNSSPKDMVPRVGILGVFNVAELLQSHAFKLTEATKKVCNEFAAPKAKMPFSKKIRFLQWNLNQLFWIYFKRRIPMITLEAVFYFILGLTLTQNQTKSKIIFCKPWCPKSMLQKQTYKRIVEFNLFLCPLQKLLGPFLRC